MADKLLIPCLYLQSGKAVTGFGQRNLFGEGNIEDLVRFYRDNGADELLVFDFSSGDKEHDQAIANIKQICAIAEIPVPKKVIFYFLRKYPNVSVKKKWSSVFLLWKNLQITKN